MVRRDGGSTERRGTLDDGDDDHAGEGQDGRDFASGGDQAGRDRTQGARATFSPGPEDGGGRALAGGVAHDFNNVLGVISLVGEALIRKIPEGSPLRGKAQQILEYNGTGRQSHAPASRVHAAAGARTAGGPSQRPRPRPEQDARSSARRGRGTGDRPDR